MTHLQKTVGRYNIIYERRNAQAQKPPINNGFDMQTLQGNESSELSLLTMHAHQLDFLQAQEENGNTFIKHRSEP